MAVLRFDPNAALEVALKYDGGKRVQSRISDAPDQMMYTVCGDDTIYVPLHVGEQIEKLGIKKMELFSICKTVKQNVTRWEVKRLSEAAEPPAPPAKKGDTFERLPTAIDATPTERKLTQSINNVREQKAQRASSLQDSPAAPASTQHTSAQQPNVTPPLQGHTRASSVMAAALIAGIDAMITAEQYAISKGIPVKPLSVEFLAEDIRCIAATLYIQACKDPLFSERMNQGGASQWRQ